MIRLLLVDDHPVVRAGVRAVLSLEPEFEVVAEAGTPEAALAAVREHTVDVVLLDLQLGEQRSGAELARHLLAEPQPPRVLVLTNYDTDADILAAVEAGASGYLLKDTPPDELISAIRAAFLGHSALAPAVANRLMQRMRQPIDQPTARELEVLSMVAEGRSNAEIAHALVLSEATVKSHLVHLFTKFGVTSRTAAVAKARQLGFLG